MATKKLHGLIRRMATSGEAEGSVTFARSSVNAEDITGLDEVLLEIIHKSTALSEKRIASSAGPDSSRVGVISIAENQPEDSEIEIAEDVVSNDTFLFQEITKKPSTVRRTQSAHLNTADTNYTLSQGHRSLHVSTSSPAIYEPPSVSPFAPSETPTSEGHPLLGINIYGLGESPENTSDRARSLPLMTTSQVFEQNRTPQLSTLAQVDSHVQLVHGEESRSESFENVTRSADETLITPFFHLADDFGQAKGHFVSEESTNSPRHDGNPDCHQTAIHHLSDSQTARDNPAKDKSPKIVPIKSICNSRFFLLLSAVIGCISCLLLLPASSFIWGILIGGSLVHAGHCLYAFILNYLYTPGHTYECQFTSTALHQSPTAFCCSLHNSLYSSWWPPYGPLVPPLASSKFQLGPLPTLRNLPPPTIPHIADEDLKTGPTGGPLGDSLGYRLNSSDKPIYKCWMNEVVYYTPEFYNINQTHSVLLTLEGTSLRIQRPKKNVPRRAMWNVPMPSMNNIHFIHQRIYDLTDVRVILLPAGLISKRLWSKKYPICLEVDNTDRKVSDKCDGDSSGRQQAEPTHKAGGSSRMLRLLSTAPNAQSADRSQSPLPSSSEDFQVITHKEAMEERIYLFTRTSREKETWFRRLYAASKGDPIEMTVQKAALQLQASPCTASGLRGVKEAARLEIGRSEAEDQNEALPTAQVETSGDAALSGDEMSLLYLSYMAKFMPANWLIRATNALRLNLNYVTCDAQVLWLNAGIGRVFWDALRDKFWTEYIREKIQNKLKKIHLPYFINELKLTSIEMGSELPVIRRAGRPFIDNQGVWVELEVSYSGGFSMDLETRVNLMRLRGNKTAKSGHTTGTGNAFPFDAESEEKGGDQGVLKMAAFRSEEEDSADPSTDTDMEMDSLAAQRRSVSTGLAAQRVSEHLATSSFGSLKAQLEAGPQSSTTGPEESSFVSADPASFAPRKRIYRIVDRITRSSYFQKAVDNKYVQRGMEYVSNTPLHLQVKLDMLLGTLVLNVPAPPSDRLWYGFRGNPSLRLKAQPRVGEKVVTAIRILEFIEKKLILEFQRVLVLPNMDDIVIPLLRPDKFDSVKTDQPSSPIHPPPENPDY